MISKFGENPTELDLFAAKGVPGTMYMAGTDTVSEDSPKRSPRCSQDLSIDRHCSGDIHSRNDVVS